MQIALEARQTASATLGSLQEQGDQLKRINRDVDDVRPSELVHSGPCTECPTLNSSQDATCCQEPDFGVPRC